MKIQLQLYQVPEYLRESVFFKTLRENASNNQQEIFEIPADKFKPDPENIATLQDYKHMIATLVFWDSLVLPAALISFALEYSGKIADLFDEEAAKLPQLRKLKAVLHDSHNVSDRARVAASVGSIQILKKLISTPSHQYTTDHICDAAAAGGHIECLKYAHSQGRPWDADTCYAAASGGHLECLQYARGNDCPWDSRTCEAAAAGGHLECLKYARGNDCPWDYTTFNAAAKGGHLECLQFAHLHGCPWGNPTCEVAAGWRLF